MSQGLHRHPHIHRCAYSCRCPGYCLAAGQPCSPGIDDRRSQWNLDPEPPRDFPLFRLWIHSAPPTRNSSREELELPRSIPLRLSPPYRRKYVLARRTRSQSPRYYVRRFPYLRGSPSSRAERNGPSARAYYPGAWCYLEWSVPITVLHRLEIPPAQSRSNFVQSFSYVHLTFSIPNSKQHFGCREESGYELFWAATFRLNGKKAQCHCLGHMSLSPQLFPNSGVSKLQCAPVFPVPGPA